MGNCLPKSKRKKNRVEPAPAEKTDINEVLSRATEFQKAKPGDPADMVKALKKPEPKTAKPEEVQADSQQESTNKKPVAFTVELSDAKTTSKVPKRLHERLCGEQEKSSELEYTNEEDALMADILRADMLKERKEKARQEDIKIYDAKRRRMVMERSKEAKLEEKQDRATPSHEDNRCNVKDLAASDRNKAAEMRKQKEHDNE